MPRPPAADIQIPLARDVMTRGVVTIGPDISLDEAYDSLSKHRFSGVPVVEDGKVVGVLSESDVLRSLASAAFAQEPVGSVRDAMRATTVTASPTSDVFWMAETMRAHHIRRLPVVDGEELVGILTIKDLDRALIGALGKRDAARFRRKPQGAAWDPEESKRRNRS